MNIFWKIKELFLGHLWPFLSQFWVNKDFAPKPTYKTLCATWYHSCNLKIVKNTHGGVILNAKSQKYKGRHRCIQHFIQHREFSMLDEMLGAFESFQNLEKNKKEEKIILDDAGWSFLSIKLFIQHFLVHSTISSCWMHLSSFSFIILPFNTALSAKHGAYFERSNVFFTIKLKIFWIDNLKTGKIHLLLNIVK